MPRLILGDALEVLRTLDRASVHCVVTSPPYWGLRDYGEEGQLGLEKTPEEYVARLVEVFGEVRRVLRDDGTLWLNMGDSYASTHSGDQGKTGDRSSRTFTARTSPKMSSGLKPKDLVGIPWRVAFALQADGWYLRQDIIWHKPNPMPESVTDRCTKSHEYVFLLSKRTKYYYDYEAVKEDAVTKAGTAGTWNGNRDFGLPGGGTRFAKPNLGGALEDGKRNRRSVWTVTTEPFQEVHFAVFPTALVEPCIKAGCPVGGTVLDPFCGSGTAGLVATCNERSFIGIDISPKYLEMARRRIAEANYFFGETQP